MKKKCITRISGEYISCGILLDGTKEKVGGVSIDKSLVESIAYAMNKYQAEPVHMMDIIEDMPE